MFAIERRQRIKDILVKEKRIDVCNLSENFQVSEVTVRRDLDKLEQEGFLIKTYGGAVLNEEHSTPIAYTDNLETPEEEKKLIAKIGAQMINEGDAVFLGPGSTILEIVKLIKHNRMTVVTNDLLVALELKDCNETKVVVTGGDLIQSSSILVGQIAQKLIQDIYLNKVFISVKGVDLDSGYTVDSYEEAMLIKQILSITKEVIIVADYTKFNKTAFARLGSFNIAKKVISNKQIPSEYKKFFFENNIKLYTTYELE
ncbi:DeoR/GlpR family DNA-binding transcription regulator [Clostridium grantii]|uniref:Transcriptional regulator, DeoR family n=1 Tax=Clostridium grantii DSM 8605 TaxID=1121316 RepID=A0A1M5SW74_9CLOT|nr:DeoR/GlpR family DNA-binding transcription regulator [Clostridium grantii]SHH42754.1 transcriptional regulator, DeoR family [Clostridium grantii DSM 8605]